MKKGGIQGARVINRQSRYREEPKFAYYTDFILVAPVPPTWHHFLMFSGNIRSCALFYLGRQALAKAHRLKN